MPKSEIKSFPQSQDLILNTILFLGNRTPATCIVYDLTKKSVYDVGLHPPEVWSLGPDCSNVFLTPAFSSSAFGAELWNRQRVLMETTLRVALGDSLQRSLHLFKKDENMGIP